MIGAGMVRNFTAQINQMQAAILALFAAGDGSSKVGFQRGEAGAVARTVQQELRDLYINARALGAVGDNVADDTARIQAAIAAAAAAGGGTVYLPPGTYRTTAPLVLQAGVSLRGASSGFGNSAPIGASVIRNAVSDIFTNGAATLGALVVERLAIVSEAGGGHIFNFAAGAGAVTNMEFVRLVLNQNNAGKAVLNATGAGGFFTNHLHDFSYSYKSGNTVPAIYIAGPSVSHVCIENFTSYGQNVAAGTFSIWIEQTTNVQAAWACTVRNGVMEQPGGGGVKLLSAQQSLIENLIQWDLSVVPAHPFVELGKSATSTQLTTRTQIKNVRATAGSAASPDIRIDTANCVAIDLNGVECQHLDGVANNTANKFTARACVFANIYNFAAISGLRRSYAPVLTNCAGAVSAQYTVQENICTVQVAVTLNAAPTGSIKVALPVAPSGNLSNIIGVASAAQGSTSKYFGGRVRISGSDMVFDPEAMAFNWNATVPFAWVNGDQFQLTASYYIGA